MLRSRLLSVTHICLVKMYFRHLSLLQDSSDLSLKYLAVILSYSKRVSKHLPYAAARMYKNIVVVHCLKNNNIPYEFRSNGILKNIGQTLSVNVIHFVNS